jgi:hypothetical protein
LRDFLQEGIAVIAGDDIVDGQQAIHIHFPSTVFTRDGKQYAVSTSDIWVSAATFLPVRVVGTNGAWTEDLTWSQQPPTPAEVTAVPPAGFTHLDEPPPRPSTGLGNG